MASLSRFLLVDFGASRIKSAIFDLTDGQLSLVQSTPALPKLESSPDMAEVDPEQLRNRFNELCSTYSAERPHFEGILLSSEMHGFLVTDAHGRAITPYISWKDERALRPIDGISSQELASAQLGLRFRAISGMRLKPGLPFVNLLHLGRDGTLTGKRRVLTLPDWLAGISGMETGYGHETMIAGLGLWDAVRRQLSDELTAFISEHTGLDCVCNRVSSSIVPAGWWKSGTHRIPIFVGVGDHQCAVLGANNVPEKTISLNLGTGSQVARIVHDLQPHVPEAAFEVRPFFESTYLTTITHIPAGRALNTYVDFIREIVTLGGGSLDPWTCINLLKLNEIKSSTLAIDLAVFRSAWNYKGGQGIRKIEEGRLDLKNYFASLIRCFAEQYLPAIQEVDRNADADQIVLSGGIPQKLPVLAPLFRELTGKGVIAARPIDETLAGLQKLAVTCSV